MTKEEILSLYKKAYKEAAEWDETSRSYYRAGPTDDPYVANQQAQFDAQQAFDRNYLPMMQSIMSRMAAPAVDNTPAGWARRALYQVYGDNHLNDLSNDAYVRRRWNAAMRGSRAASLRTAYNQARMGSNGMAASNGWYHGGRSGNGFNSNYGIGTPYRRPMYQTARTTQPKQTGNSSIVSDDMRKEVLGSLGNNS